MFNGDRPQENTKNVKISYRDKDNQSSTIITCRIRDRLKLLTV